MTNPPQPPQNPYGQQPGWQQQPPGWQQQPPPGYQQQPPGHQQPPGYPPPPDQPPAGYQPPPDQQQFGQQPPPGQYPPPDPSGGMPGQPGGWGGAPPPKKSKTGLWVGLSAGAVVVIVLLITGFVAPGFFLGDDDSSAGATSGGGAGSEAPADPSTGDTGSGGGDSGAGGPAAMVTDLITALNNGDRATVDDAKCSFITKSSEQTIDRIINGEAQLKQQGQLVQSQQSKGAAATLGGTLDGQQFNGSLVLTNQGSWCMSTLIGFGS